MVWKEKASFHKKVVKVSVIIPVYNHSKYLRERIDSILLQTCRDFELIILDDCSTDSSRDIIDDYVRRYPDIRTSFNSKNSGSPAYQWNRGVDMAKGEYIWIAESDDSATPSFLEKTMQVLDNYQNAGMVFTDSWVINEMNGAEYLASERNKAFSIDRLVGYFNIMTGKSKSLQPFLENPIANNSSVLFRKSRFLEAGGADFTMKFCFDWLLYLKIYLNSDIKYVPEPLNIFRLHPGSSFHSHYRSNTYLKEKMKIFSFIIGKGRFSLVMIFLIMKKIIKALVLRMLFYLNLNTILKIELPRQPQLLTK